MNIKEALSLEGYDNDIRKIRRKGSKSTQEFFTPFEIVKKMSNKIPSNIWADPNKTFLEPCFGNGQFIIYIIWKRLQSNISLIQVLNTLFGIELIEDNVNETKERILNFLYTLDLEFNENKVKSILDKNLICIDFFKWNSNVKYDVCLMNPPYGSSGGDTLHLRFIDALYNIVDRMIVIMPFGFVTKDVKSFRKYQERFSNKLSTVEEVNSNLFIGTAMASVAIYDFDSNHKGSLQINYLNGNIEYRTNLFEISEFTEYEKEFISYLEKQGSQPIVNDLGRLNSWRKLIENLSEEDKILTIKDLVIKSLQKLKRYNYKYVLLVNRANGVMNARAITKKNGQIFTYDELVEFFTNKPIGIGYNGLLFDSKEAAENCKKALQRPLLRLTIKRLQKDQNLTIKTYRCIPRIDWKDPKCLTDEGILEICGCPKHKIDEYVKYINEQI